MKKADQDKSQLQVEVRRLKEKISELQLRLSEKVDAEHRCNDALEQLHSHREELQSQNETLMAAQTKIEFIIRKYQDLYNFAPVGFFSFDSEGKILEVNIAGAELLGQYRDALIGKPFGVFLDNKSKKPFSRHLRSVLNGVQTNDTIWLAMQNKPSFPAEIISAPYDSEFGQDVGCRSAIKDISERHKAEVSSKTACQELEKANQNLKNEIEERHATGRALLRSEDNLKASLREKEALLQEIHHRVKNNLQVIRSMLNLQAANIQDESVKAHFKDSSSRVNAMAIIHEMLYQSASLSEIDLNQYITGLVSGLERMYNTFLRIRIQVNAEHIRLGIDQAIPCGLILNELISNAFKHAFSERTGNSNIVIEATSVSHNHIGLTVSDNGVGMPPDFEFQEHKTLGMKLVRGLAEKQLGGTLKIIRGDGTRFEIVFPNEISLEKKVDLE